MWTMRHRFPFNICPPYGDATYDPWPGDIALLDGGWRYRFDGQVWKFTGQTQWPV